MPETETVPTTPADDYTVFSDIDPTGDAASAGTAEVVPPTASQPADATPPAAEDTALADEGEAEPVLTPEQQASDAGKALAKQRGSLQKRIDTLTRERHTSAREAAAARGEAEQLRAELAALKGGKAAAPVTPEPAEAPATMPKREDIGTKYESYEDYTEAHSKWSVEEGRRLGREDVLKELAARDDRARAEAHARAQQDANVERTARIASFREAHADFDTVVSDPALQITGAMAEVLVDDESGPALAYYLGQHPEECTRIAALSASRAAAALGELKARVVSPSTSVPTPKAKPLTRAPAPPTPVGAGPTASTVALDQLDPDEYIRVRNEQEYAARRRR